jgi:hypothetical protein
MRKIKLSSFLVGALCAALLACSPSADDQAKKVMAEAQQFFDRAQTQSGDERLSSLQSAQDRLQQIIAKFPTSNLAKQLSQGQAIGSLSLDGLSDAIATEAWPSCQDNPHRACLIGRAQQLARSADLNAYKDDAFARAYGLSGLARLQFMAGQSNEARKSIEAAQKAALDMAASASPEQALLTLQSLTGSLTLLGQVDQAWDLQKSLSSLFDKAGSDYWTSADLARRIVDEQVRSGKSKDAASFIAQKGAAAEAELLPRLANGQMDDGQIPDAKRTILKAAGFAREQNLRIETLMELAIAEYRSGLTSDANTLIQKTIEKKSAATPALIQALDLIAIARAQARTARNSAAEASVNEALAKAQTLPRSVQNAIAPVFAEGLAQAGRFQEAVNLTKNGTDPLNQALVLMAISQWAPK